jgi:hypothetical protein
VTTVCRQVSKELINSSIYPALNLAARLALSKGGGAGEKEQTQHTVGSPIT